MDGFAALNRYIVERSPHRRLQPNASLMIADPDAAAGRRSFAVAYRLCFHAPKNTAPNRKRSRTNEEPRWRRRGFSLMLGGSDILCRKGVGSISPALLGRLCMSLTWPLP